MHDQWVLHLGGPEDGEHHPVPLDGGRLPARVSYPEYAPGSDVWPGGPVVVRVHQYEVVDSVVGERRPIYRYMDTDG